MPTLKIDLIAGARPNFMKIASVIDAIHQHNRNFQNFQIHFRLVHTGQHYDSNMSDLFFQQLNLPQPDVFLHGGNGTPAEQTGQIMVRYEQILLENSPECCLVVGDVNSTMACAISAQKQKVKVAHIEAGLRSGDWEMPEEINRLLTDSITNFFFTTTVSAGENLRKTGVAEKNIHFVGNTMIDTLIKNRPRFVAPECWNILQLAPSRYFLLTLHRPSNVDNPQNLSDILLKIIEGSKGLPIIFPVHPRTQKVLALSGIQGPNLHCLPPLGYLEFGYLVERTLAMVTDSGGISEETTYLSIPCLTLRNTTERPETVEIGTNELLGNNPKSIVTAMDKVLSGSWKKGNVPPKWDGHAGERVVRHLIDSFFPAIHTERKYQPNGFCL